ncbi:uncharacterized protein LOC119091037 [Pollicipes pollicipes]|uniref:uncharacterized protein LOC119091037 n=1 Tax=Pollicipes pollicipes TaxID=41117 RepID=UPI0018859E1A|nr:uncharacterized protein LOC119091037 [Pollicipes pollicipes]
MSSMMRALSMVKSGQPVDKAAAVCKVSAKELLASQAEWLRATRRLLTPPEECVFASGLVQLIELGWELNRDSVRVLMRWFLPHIGKKRAERVVLERESWQQWVGWFERQWARLQGRISRLPGQPTDEFLAVARGVLQQRVNRWRRLPAPARPAAGKRRRRDGDGGDDDEEVLYEVDRIMARRRVAGGDEFLIKWCGFGQ